MGVLLVGLGFCWSEYVELYACGGSHSIVCAISVVEVSLLFAELWKPSKARSLFVFRLSRVFDGRFLLWVSASVHPLFDLWSGSSLSLPLCVDFPFESGSGLILQRWFTQARSRQNNGIVRRRSCSSATGKRALSAIFLYLFLLRPLTTSAPCEQGKKSVVVWVTAPSVGKWNHCNFDLF